MSFWKTGDTDSKIIAKAVPDKSAQFAAVLEILRPRLPVGVVFGRISSQRQDVLNSARFYFIQNFSDFFFRVAHTGQVRHPDGIMVLLDVFDDVERFFAAAAPGAVGDRNKIRLKQNQRSDRFQEFLVSCFGFGREKLEGKGL